MMIFPQTQTYEVRSLSVQPCRESGTQMERIDLRIDHRRDVIMYPKSYFTSDELLAKVRVSTYHSCSDSRPS